MNVLQGYVAVELAGLLGQLCGRILADLGMDVIKVEDIEGDGARTLPPLDGELSLAFAHMNAGKRSVAIDFGSQTGQDLLTDLIGEADAFITTLHSEELHNLGLDLGDLRRARPELVTTSLTGFGREGPYRDYLCPDIVGQAMGGQMYISGHPTQPPVRGPETQSYYLAGVHAAQGTLLALWRRQQRGHGGAVDVTVQEAMATTDQLIRLYGTEGTIVRRQGSQHEHVAPARVFATADGHVYLFVAEQHWTKFLELWPSHPEEFEEPEWRSVHTRIRHADHINDLVQRFVEQFATDDFLRLMSDGGIPCTQVNTLGGFLTDEQLRVRGLLTPSEDTRLHGVPQVAFPALIDGRRPSVSAAPAIGQHTDEVLRTLPGMTPGRMETLHSKGVVRA